MCYKKTGLLWFLLVFCIIASDAQSSNPVFAPVPFPTSPNASALGKFGDYPVSYFSGLPNISIPLYEVQAGSLKVPITLAYHASGNRITDVASWVGLGWALDAGGQITRKVMGAREDEIGYIGSTMWLQSALDPTTFSGQSNLDALAAGSYDTEPDIFSYNFPGKSGRFFFNINDGFKATQIPYSPVAINYTSLHEGGFRFVLTDETGNNYYYNSPSTTQTASSSNFSAITGWMLDTIVSADKRDTITFKYASVAAFTYVDVIDSWVVVDHVTNDQNVQPANYYVNPNGRIGFSSVSSSTTEQFLQEIDYKNGKVVFDLTSSAREDVTGFKSLADIKIYSYDKNANQYNLMKTIVPFQSYFEQGTDVTTKRLRFDSLQIKDATGIAIEKYSFKYNSLMLPKTDSKARDYWGYYNGKANNSLIPRQIVHYAGTIGSGTTTDITIGSNITNGRDADTIYNQACMLTSIYYPTGGHTDFAYETNRYTSPATGNDSLSGGLRIKSMSSYDSLSTTPNVKTYEYNASRANYILSDFYFKTSQKYEHYQCEDHSTSPPKTPGEETKIVTTYLSNPTIDIVPYDATPVVYPVVTEYNGSSTNNTGKTVFRFTDYPDVLDGSASVKPVVNSYAYRRGQLISKTVYRNNGSSLYQPLSKEQHGYTAFPSTLYSNVGFVIKVAKSEEGDCLPFDPNVYRRADWVFSNYAITSDDNYPTSATTVQYDQFDSTKYVSQTVSYTYGNIIHQQVTKTSTFNSKGDTIISVKKYPADYIASGSAYTGNAVLDSMLVHNMQAVEIEGWDSLKSVSGVSGLTGVISGQLTKFKQLSPGIIKPDFTSKLEIQTPVLNFTPSSVSSGQLQYDSRYKPTVTFTGYDGYSNIREYKARNAMPLSIIWDYNGTLPVAKIEAAVNNDVAYTSFEADGKGNWSFSGAPVSDVTAPTGRYVYNMHNGSLSKSLLANGARYIVSYWSKNGTYTITGGSGTVKTGKTIDGWTYYEHTITTSSTTLTIGSTSGTTYIDEVRLYPVTSQMTTFTYTPFVGMTSQCDLNNRITYYKYDAYNRLSYIRDQDKNVIKKICYNYYNQQDACANTLFGNVAKSKDYIRNNCSSGYQGSTVTYTVPAGTYSAYSQAAADVLAQNDVNTNGQSYANAHGTCSVIPDVPITSANIAGVSGWKVDFIQGVNTVASFTIPLVDGTIGTVPPGTYRVVVSKSGNSTSYVFGVCSGVFTTGASGTFFNVAVSSSACNQISISPWD